MTNDEWENQFMRLLSFVTRHSNSVIGLYAGTAAGAVARRARALTRRVFGSSLCK
jgi:hypothetical protein